MDTLVVAGAVEERKTYRERLGSVPNWVDVVPLLNSKPFKAEVSAGSEYKTRRQYSVHSSVPDNFVDKTKEFTAETCSCNDRVDGDSTAPVAEGCLPPCSTSASKVLEVSPPTHMFTLSESLNSHTNLERQTDEERLRSAWRVSD